MKIFWSDGAWGDYCHWQKTDPKMHQRINALVDNIVKTPTKGIGKPEPLKYNWAGYWSRRITKEHRLVYKVTDDGVFVAQCRFHY